MQVKAVDPLSNRAENLQQSFPFKMLRGSKIGLF